MASGSMDRSGLQGGIGGEETPVFSTSCLRESRLISPYMPDRARVKGIVPNVAQLKMVAETQQRVLKRQSEELKRLFEVTQVFSEEIKQYTDSREVAANRMLQSYNEKTRAHSENVYKRLSDYETVGSQQDERYRKMERMVVPPLSYSFGCRVEKISVVDKLVEQNDQKWEEIGRGSSVRPRCVDVYQDCILARYLFDL
eukprot:jgi/Bigna1/89452/estExt_fgenesh1_pg.C_490113